MHVELSGGESAEMKTVDEIRHRSITHWRTMGADLLKGIDREDQSALIEPDDQHKAYIVAGLITSWTLTGPDKEPLPVTADNVRDLSALDVGLLYEAAGPVIGLVNGRPVDPKSRPSSGG